MAKAYRCDRCGEFHEGKADISMGLDKQSDIIFRHSLGIKFSPENETAPICNKDLCNKCTKDFVRWWRKEVSNGTNTES